MFFGQSVLIMRSDYQKDKMKKRIISLVLILSVLFTAACGSRIVTFENSFMSFAHTAKYKELSENNQDIYCTFLPDNAPGLFSFRISPKFGDVLEDIAMYYQFHFSKPGENLGFDKTTDMTIEGKIAKFITFGSPGLRISFLIIDYSEDDFLIFDFYINEGEDTDKVTMDIINSIKFK